MKKLSCRRVFHCISLPPTQPEYGCNHSHSWSTLCDVTGSRGEAPAFFRDQVSEPLCVCHELLCGAQVGSHSFFSLHTDPWSGHSVTKFINKLIRVIQFKINVLKNNLIELFVRSNRLLTMDKNTQWNRHESGDILLTSNRLFQPLQAAASRI